MNKKPVYKSCVRWPPEAYNLDGCVTTDEHATFEQAQGVVRALRREGFGCEREHFPLDAWVEEPNGNKVRMP